MSAALAVIDNGANVEAYRASTNAASICKQIVVETAKNIQGRKYVCVEGWQAIAVAHGCAASARDVEKVDGGVRAAGEVRRMSDGAVIAVAEGFVGEDEPVWFGGKDNRGKVHPRRLDYAIRAMAQTRAISRACRSAFAHVVVMMNAGLATTPAEEVPDGGFQDDARAVEHVQPEKPRFITDAQRQELTDLATPKNIGAATICRLGGIASLAEMPADAFEEAKAWINRQKVQPLKPAPAPASEILDDEIPY
ncbi:hypothetical protein [Sphingomonas baiyangensis]|uniref:Uncharacterized protein n=1 Tax=Sphingomonas baiyangensis TaxID=2572576 RepID=A0A4U1L0D3_9SPHN|nr:hypothetical protein [Sphingomonas baiyangensis]TKD50189.1 hypothetical protein FBR43_05045 [Sphingomonas baiyangensis]